MALSADEVPVGTGLDLRPDTDVQAAYRIVLPLPFQMQNTGERVTEQAKIPDLFSTEAIHVLLQVGKERHADTRPSWRTADFDLRPGESSELPGRLYYVHFTTPNPGSKPPKQIGYTLVVLSENFSVANDRGEEMLAGHVEARGDKFFVDVRGCYGSSTGFFRGEVEMEKPFQPTGYIFSGGVHVTRFVLSSSPDCSPFLKVPDASDK